MDEDGYPTDEELLKIREWKVDKNFDIHELMDYAYSLWRYQDENYFKRIGNSYRLVTGGWSGNEDVIKALQNNLMFWLMYWESSDRGGLHTFCKCGDEDLEKYDESRIYNCALDDAQTIVNKEFNRWLDDKDEEYPDFGNIKKEIDKLREANK